MPEFADPLMFVLLALPVLVYVLLPSQGHAGAALVVPESVGRVLLAGAEPLGQASWRRLALPALLWFFLVTALAGPRVLAPQQALPMSGRDLILTIDLSGSMVRDDFELDGRRATRLEAVKSVAAAFARQRSGDRIGLVVFGSGAYVAAAPSFDTQAIARSIEEMVIGISGRATNISDALGIGLKRLVDSDAETKVILLLSDGANNAGAAKPVDVAALAAKMGVRVHTIALGPVSLQEDPEDRGGVDAETLRKIALISGGEMFRVKTTADLQNVTAQLDALEPTARAGLAAETYRDLWVWPAILAVVSCLSMVIGARR